MKRIFTFLIGVSLLATTGLFAQENVMSMQHSSGAAMAKEMKVGGYKVTLSSEKPLVSGANTIKIQILLENKIVTDAKVKIRFFMPV